MSEVFSGAVFRVLSDAEIYDRGCPEVEVTLPRESRRNLAALLHAAASAMELASPPEARWDVAIGYRILGVRGYMQLYMHELGQLVLATQTLRRVVAVMEAELGLPLTPEESKVVDQILDAGKGLV